MLGEEKIAKIVEEVLHKLKHEDSGRSMPYRLSTEDCEGVFSDPEKAIKAAKAAQSELICGDLKKRGEIVNAIRAAAIENAREIARIALEETGYGNIDDKIQKKIYSAKLTPGIENLNSEVCKGDKGFTVIEHIPFGLIASIEPATHPGSCVINHAISMIASGNSVYFLPHPKGLKTTQYTIRLFNRAIRKAGGPANLLVVGNQVTIDVVDRVINHPETDLVVVTGGPYMAQKALQSGKKAIVAGPGNPPVMVDETVQDMAYAAKCIVEGAAFDNTVLCIAEKVIIAVEVIAESLLHQLERNGAFLVKDEVIAHKLMKTVLPDGEKFNPEITGMSVEKILRKAGIASTNNNRIAIIECEPGHPLVMQEQLFPVLPFIKVKDFAAGLETASHVEQGFKHTAVIHSQSISRIVAYANKLRTDITVSNATSAAGLNIGGEGHFSHTIASPTGEGICTPRTYTREQRTIISAIA